MLCTRLLTNLYDQEDYDILILMRSVEFTIYIKTSKVQHFDEQSVAKLFKLSQYDQQQDYQTLYVRNNEFFISPNNVFDSFVKNKPNWSYGDESRNYEFSLLKISLLKNLIKFLKNDDMNFSLILFNQQKSLPLAMFMYCNEELAKNELDFILKKDGGKMYFKTLDAMRALEKELPFANKKFLEEDTIIYIQTKMLPHIEKAIEYMQEKEAN
ncbi:hypothetical protein [[Mycoplasma] anseris]|uniref:Uncharacterized protein n=1 Tax=[Mycoplasma] anseris TaxID=92400 RepID=A0A2Z4NDK5_9BACT|nr:hypothetical protein [[Mycoplasma] anseris]AWX69588.1 hypothetical protein DP065_02380 [[Mycoplasma] anseris]